jgi:hypothetical protein
MELNQRTLTRILLPAALAAFLLPAVPARAATVYLEGVVTSGPDPDCVLVKDAQGNSFVLEGTGWYGVVGNDYVRLQGTIVPESRCGATSGIQVADVSTIWRDQTHREIVYERSKEGRFADWVRAHRESQWRQWEQEHHIPPPPPSQK